MLIKDGVLSIATGNSPENAKKLLFSILNPPDNQNILTVALEKWENEKSKYFGAEEVQDIRNILKFKT